MVIGAPTILNLIPGKVFPVVNVNQYDAGYQKTFLLYKGAEVFNIASNMSVTIRGTKGDKNGIADSAASTRGSNLISVTLTEQMTAVAGPNIYELRIVDTNGLLVGTVNFILMVEPAALGDGTVISDSDLNYAADVLDRLQSVEAFKNQLDAVEDKLGDTGFVAETVDILRPYPLLVTALYDADHATNKDTVMSQQSMAVERDSDGRAQYIYMMAAAHDDTNVEVSKFQRTVAETGHVTWTFMSRNYINNTLGHADGAMFMNGALWVRNGRKIYEINSESLALTGASKTISAFNPRGMGYDPITDQIVMTASTNTGEKTLDTLYFLNTDFEIEKTVTVDTMDNYIAQDCGFYDGIVYVIAGNFGYSSSGVAYSVDTGLSAGSNVMCYTTDGEYLKSIPVEGYVGEVEGIDVDATGYMYLSVNHGYAGVPSSPLGMALEAPLFTNSVESLRTPLYEKSSTMGAPAFNADIYLDSEVGSVKNYGIGLGLRTSPFKSFFAVSLAVHKLNAAGVKSVYIHIMHMSAPNIYDCALRIVGNSSNVYVYDDNNSTYDGVTVYKIGGLEAVDSSYVDIRNLGIKPPTGTIVGLTNPVRILRVDMVAIRRCKLYGGAGNLNRIEGSLVYLDEKVGFFDGVINIYQSTIEESADCEIERTTVVYTGHNLGDGRWSNLNMRVIANEIAQTFKSKYVLIPSVTIGGNGYTNISNYAPSTPDGYELFMATIWSIGEVSAKTSVSLGTKGNYLFGTAGATVTSINVYYLFIKRGYNENLS